jgi:hypothetical protein
MGSDMSLIVEEYQNYGNHYGWFNISDFKINHYPVDCYDDTDKSPFIPVNIYPHRDYDCFYALVGVRGIFCEDLIPISEPRGFPIDICEFSKPFIQEHSGEDCTTSYVLISELYNHVEKYPFFTQKGYVSIEQAESFKKDGATPKSYCGYTSNKSKPLLKWQTNNPLIGLIEAVEKLVAKNSYLCLNERRKDNSHKIRILFAID